jgi:type I restriction enzyme M protein
MQANINRITDILRRDDGISGAMQYTEQISRILFLKYLNDYEENQQQTAILNGETYHYLLEPKYRRTSRACPKKDGKLDVANALAGEDLKDFVNKELFPYLKSFRQHEGNFQTITYKIGEIFYFLDNKIES